MKKRKNVVVEEQTEVSAAVMAAEAEVRQPAAIKIKVTAVLEVTKDFLKDVEGNVSFIRSKIQSTADGLDGAVVSVEIA